MLKKLNNRLRFNRLSTSAAIIFLILFLGSSAFAETTLRRANIYKLINQVLINGEQASNDDKLIPGYELETGSNSRADLLFNEGTLARAPSNTEFNFRAGTRRFELSEGTALFILRPGGEDRVLKTPTVEVTAKPGTAFWATYNAEQNQTRVGVFATHQEPVQVSPIQKSETIQLQPGQAIDIGEHQVDDPQALNLEIFYQTSGLADGLRPGDDLDEYPSELRKILEPAQENASSALQKQQEKFEEELDQSNNDSTQENGDNNKMTERIETELGQIQFIQD